MRRYDVATVTGYRTMTTGDSKRPPGISAHVVDRFYNCAIVASFHSEDRLPRSHGQVLGPTLALTHAEKYADELNKAER